MTATFADSTHTGLGWSIVERTDGVRLSRSDVGRMSAAEAARLAKRLRRRGVSIVVRGEGPGSSDIEEA